MADDKATQDVAAEQAAAKNEAELKQWEGDFKEEDLTIPYKRDENEDSRTEDEASEADTSDDEEDTNQDSETTEEDNTDEPVEVYSEPEPVVTMADPGDWTEPNLSFEITLSDGKTHTIKSVEEAEAIADDPDNFETPKQLTQFLTKLNRMTNERDKAHDKWETDKAKYDSQVETENERQQTVANYSNEFQYLADKGLLPQIPNELANADWFDPEVAKDPLVKQYKAILNYMVKENEARAKAKVAPLNSVIDAYNAMQVDPANRKAREDKAKEEEQVRAQANARKAAGARVAGASPSAAQPYVPKGIAVGNPRAFNNAGSIWED